MHRKALTLAGIVAFGASTLNAGGWETGTLPTSMMYEEGNYIELSYGSLTYNLDGRYIHSHYNGCTCNQCQCFCRPDEAQNGEKPNACLTCSKI